MLPFTLINPTPYLLIFMTMFGIFVHDMNIDKAAKVVLSPASVTASKFASKESETFISRADHTHVERASAPRLANAYSSSLPKVQPPRDDQRHYAQNKKVFISGDHTGLWPSI